ncbi:MAG: hypothetical protein J6S05_06945 [Bacteroidaceae bacterium]|nr:hypothetical protein [Bacteroidaceae bacterium]
MVAKEASFKYTFISEPSGFKVYTPWPIVKSTGSGISFEGPEYADTETIAVKAAATVVKNLRIIVFICLFQCKITKIGKKHHTTAQQE